MKDYCVPTAASETELTEKRSRFIGHVFPVESEEMARACIEDMKRKYHDARHNCWCYIVKEPLAERYSDDGEPQGTAGRPMLEVFRREGVTNVCCVVTRYFGGILLGAGGLTRAYGSGAKNALDAAGISVVRRWVRVTLSCPYPLFERAKLAVAVAGGVLDGTEYAADIEMRVLLPEGGADAFVEDIVQLTAGAVTPQVTGAALQTTPRAD